MQFDTLLVLLYVNFCIPRKKNDEFVYCLKKMLTDDSDILADCDGNSLEEYTTIWLNKTDRGGLSHVSDVTFWLFCEIEIVVYDKLKKCYAGRRTAPSCNNYCMGNAR